MSLPDLVRSLPIYVASFQPKVTGIELMPSAVGKYSNERFTWGAGITKDQVDGLVTCNSMAEPHMYHAEAIAERCNGYRKRSINNQKVTHRVHPAKRTTSRAHIKAIPASRR
jgi:hypothetical protein